MRFLKTYLLIAFATCSICTILLILNCNSGFEESKGAETGKWVSERKEPPKPETFLFISILSSPNETSRRQNVRQTWFQLSKKGGNSGAFLAKFSIGIAGISEQKLAELREEKLQFGDLEFLENHEEAYEKLARKTLASIQDAYQKYTFRFFLKVDADSFVRITPLLMNLKAVQHPMLYWGFLDGRAKPFRKGKWKEPEWNLCDRYLPYQLGGGYILSWELVRFLSINAKLFKMYKNEDVSVGAWLAGLDVKYVHDPRFDTEWTSRGCNNEYLITHKHSEQQMLQLYENLKTTGRLCQKEFQRRPSYVYDFSKAPSECCSRINGSNIP